MPSVREVIVDNSEDIIRYKQEIVNINTEMDTLKVANSSLQVSIWLDCVLYVVAVCYYCDKNSPAVCYYSNKNSPAGITIVIRTHLLLSAVSQELICSVLL